ncbi:MAG: tetrathionate reductase family octaheme c-type cytochrome [Thermodesulfobacteriota bacterium]
MKKKMMLHALVLGLLAAGSSSQANEDAKAMHAEIEGPFASPMEVTKACINCHDDVATEVMATSHWTWATEQKVDGKKEMRGKQNVMNNFCGAIKSNEPRCTSCHVGYGWKDGTFDFTDQSRVDCLVCHDTTSTYKKPGAGAGMPAGYTGKASMDKNKVDLLKVARNVGKPERDDCLSCHAFGGGGNNVKHGDIGKALINPTKEVDVHMGSAASGGQDFACQECHTTEAHKIAGNSLIVSPMGSGNDVTCEQCHDAEPHSESTLNSHAAAVSCQACHIPAYAKVDGTKMSWDWSKSEKRPKGKVVEKDSHGHKVYIAKKGLFTYEDNVVPSYRWYNGTAGTYALGDKIDPKKPTPLNYPLGSIKDKKAKIMPFKIHTGKQIYDTVNNYFATAKVWGPKGDKEAYWVNYKSKDPKVAANAWNEAAKAGMKANGLEYSGKYGFAETETYWPINHMVAEKDKALGCLDCHGDKGRLDWQSLGYKGDPMKVKGAARKK